MSAPKSIAAWCTEVHALAVSKGWYEDINLDELRHVTQHGSLADDEDRRYAATYVLSRIALMHSELSEAVEEARHDRYRMYLGPDGKPEGVVVELADAVIRIMDTAAALGLDLQGAIEAKHEKNAARPARHGGRSA